MTGRFAFFACVFLGLLLPRASSAQTKPDLSIIGVKVPYSGSTKSAASSFTVRYIVNCEHKSILAKLAVEFLYCDTTSSSSCKLLGTQILSTSFSAGQFRTFFSPTLTLPVSARYGKRHVWIKLDSGNDVAESNESNNTSKVGITVTVRPDLTIPKANVSSAKLKAGSSFTVQPTILNAAKTSAVTQAFSLTYYYCPSKSASGCTVLGSEQISTGLYSGSSFSHGSPNLKIPAGAASGVRYVRVMVDSTKAVVESNEGNNGRFVPLAIQDSKPDLAVDSTTVPYSGSTKSAGATFTARCQVKNKSTLSLTKDFNLNYYYCAAKQGTSGCSYIGQKKVTYNFGAKSAKYFNSPTITLPVTASLGTGYVRFFVDGTDVVSETNESNNDAYHAVKVATKPDLLVSKATVPAGGSVAAPGAKFTAKYFIKNQPKTSAFATPFAVAFHYCPSMGGSGCVKLGEQKVSATFNSGAAYALTTKTLTIPPTASPGFRYVRATVDSGKAVAESDETNNLRYSPINVVAAPKDAGSDATDAGLDAGASDLAPGDAGSGDTGGQAADAATDTGAQDGGAKEGWFWPDQGSPTSADAAEKAGPPITASGCQCRAGGGAGAPWLLLGLALLLLRARRRRR